MDRRLLTSFCLITVVALADFPRLTLGVGPPSGRGRPNPTPTATATPTLAPPPTPTATPTPTPSLLTSTHTFDLSAMVYETDRTDLLRSSAFFNPRTNQGATLYFTQFPDHFAVRPFGIFEWEILNATDLDSFRNRLELKRNYVSALAQTHSKFIITITLMPQWLSSSSDDKIMNNEDYWRGYHAHGPQDYEAWRQIVAVLANFLKQFESVEIYYEVWNEPDLYYWQDGTDAYLRLYEQTAEVIKAIDPSAKVGGATANWWNGKAEGDSERDMLNLELIRWAKPNGVALDFVSWHHFGHRVSHIEAAKETYESALLEMGYDPMPEFVISEWNVGPKYRGTSVAAAWMGEVFLAMYKARVDIQTVSAWEDFHPDSGPEGYGLVTQQGEKKPVFYTHQFFDRLARGSLGIAVEEVALANPIEGVRRVFISRKSDERYDIIYWENGYTPPTAAAIEYLLAQGVTFGDLQLYGTMEQLDLAIRTGQALQSEHSLQFTEAQGVWNEHPGRKPITLEFSNIPDVNVISAFSVKSAATVKEVFVEQNKVTFDLDKFEVLFLDIELD